MASELTSRFQNREAAARALAAELQHLRGSNPLVLAIPRGAVKMAKIIADEIDGELDLLLVHKVGHPYQPEYAIGAVDERGNTIITDPDSYARISHDQFKEIADREVAALKSKRRLYSPYRPAPDFRGRVCVVVDDGIATGSTVKAAVRTLREAGAKQIIVSAPVASRQAFEVLRDEHVELAVLKVPSHFISVSQHFEVFDQVEDEEVVSLMSAKTHEAIIEDDGLRLNAIIEVPSAAKGLVIFAHGSGSGRFSSRNQYVSEQLNQAGYATLLADLLSETESRKKEFVFNIDLLANRVVTLVKWVSGLPSLNNLPIALFGASTGAGAAVKASVLAKQMNFKTIKTVVSRGGRVDLADDVLSHLDVPTLLIVGGNDSLVLDLNRMAMKHVKGAPIELSIVDGATHLFEEDGALDKVARLATSWLDEHMVTTKSPEDTALQNLPQNRSITSHL